MDGSYVERSAAQATEVFFGAYGGRLLGRMDSNHRHHPTSRVAINLCMRRNKRNNRTVDDVLYRSTQTNIRKKNTRKPPSQTHLERNVAVTKQSRARRPWIYTIAQASSTRETLQKRNRAADPKPMPRKPLFPSKRGRKPIPTQLCKSARGCMTNDPYSFP